MSSIVLSMHIPLTTCNDPANPADNTADCRALLALLSGRPHTVSFSGHMHTSEHHHLGAEHGFAGPGRHHHQVLAAASGSWWGGPRDGCGMPNAVCPDGTPNGFHVLSVDGAELFHALRAGGGQGCLRSCACWSTARGGTGNAPPACRCRQAAGRADRCERAARPMRSSSTCSTAARRRRSPTRWRAPAGPRLPCSARRWRTPTWPS